MPVELPLHPNQIGVEDLVGIYKCFCQAFEIEVTPRDERFMRREGLDRLRSQFGLDYRPYMGAKFFGNKRGNLTVFHGYRSPEDSEEQARDRQFQELVLQYFKKPED